MNKKKWILLAAALVALALVAVLLVSWFGGDSGVTPGKPGNTVSGTDGTRSALDDGTLSETAEDTAVLGPDVTVSFGVTDRDEDWDEPDSETTPVTTQQTQPSTQNTQPEQTQPQDTTVGTEPAEEMTYEKFTALSGDEQWAFIESFSSEKEFILWYNAAKAAYEATQNDYTLDPNDPNIDFGDLVGNQP